MGGRSSGSQTVGFRYYMSMHMGIARGRLNEICQIDVGGLRAWPIGEGVEPPSTLLDAITPTPSEDIKFVAQGPNTSESVVHYADGTTAVVPAGERNTILNWGDQYRINSPKLFGGDEREGGVEGSLKVSMGTDSDDPRPWFSAVGMPGIIPGMRGVVSLLFDGLICSGNPYPKKWSFRVRRTDAGWEGATWQKNLCTVWLKDNTIRAMNPAHIIVECITNTSWGRGLPMSVIHQESFIQAAQTAHDEGLGLCMKWTRTNPLDQFIGVVLDHIGGSLYVHRSTGQIAIKLFRADYDPDEVPLYDYDSGLLSVVENETSTHEDTVNEVVVKWFDPTTNSERESRVQNIASMQTFGGKNTSVKDYGGIPTEELALRIAQRDLKVGVTALKRYTVELDRRAWALHPGALIRIKALDLGIANAVLRVGKVTESGGTSGKISVEAVIDVFGLPASSYASTQSPEWGLGSKRPTVVTPRLVREATWAEMVVNTDPANLALVAAEAGFVTSMGAKPTPLSQFYRIATKPSGETFEQYTGSGPFNPTVQLSAALAWSATALNFTNGNDLGLAETGSALQIGNEICEVTNITTSDGTSGTLTIRRGCVDTLPQAHASGVTAFFFTIGDTGRDDIEYVEGESVDVKLLGQTSAGTLSLDAAPTDTLTIRGRQGRPYPPAHVLVNGVPYLDVVSPIGTSTDIQLEWRHRDRTKIMDKLVAWNASSTSNEPYNTYTIRLYKGSGSTAFRTVTDLEANSYLYTSAMADSDDAGLNIRFEIESVRNGITSTFKHVFNIYR